MIDFFVKMRVVSNIFSIFAAGILPLNLAIRRTMRKIKVNEDMKHSFKRVPNDACIGGIGCVVSEFAGVALKGICVLRTLVLVAAMVIGAASASA